MRAFVQKPKTLPTTATKTATIGRSLIRQSRDLTSVAHLQRTIGNRAAVQRPRERNRDEVKEELVGTQSTRLGHDFSRLPVHAPPATATRTRNADGIAADDEDITQAPTPAPAPGVFPPSPPPPAAPAAPSRQCHVTSGPTYTPSGTIPVTNTGGRKSATFSMAARFGTAFVTVPPRVPSCCEVRQYIRWDDAYHRSKGGPPHGGFPSSATAGTWYEDRDASDKRYGHRSGVHSDPIAGCGDEYLTGRTRDQANGDTYCGRDSPGAPATRMGTFNFQLKVIDTCNGSMVKARSSIITVRWG